MDPRVARQPADDHRYHRSTARCWAPAIWCACVEAARAVPHPERELRRFIAELPTPVSRHRLDGNAVPRPSVRMLELGPPSADAIVEMNRPGVSGETRAAQREAGLGIAIEHAG
jgi:hypothetical protein